MGRKRDDTFNFGITSTKTTTEGSMCGCTCPSRWTLSMAWSSVDGFHQGSSSTTTDAQVRFRPTPPALRLMSINRGDDDDGDDDDDDDEA